MVDYSSCNLIRLVNMMPPNLMAPGKGLKRDANRINIDSKAGLLDLTKACQLRLQISLAAASFLSEVIDRAHSFGFER